MKRSLVVFVALGLLAGLVGCSESSDEIGTEVDVLEEKVSTFDEAPKSLTDLKGPLPESLQQFQSELLDGEDPTQVPLVQRNFLEGCMAGAPFPTSALAKACGCGYEGIIKFAEANATEETSAFDIFVDMDYNPMKYTLDMERIIGACLEG